MQKKNSNKIRIELYQWFGEWSDEEEQQSIDPPVPR